MIVGSPRKILVIGNCQARPVAAYLSEMSNAAVAAHAIIAHLSSQQTQASDIEAIATADCVLSQPISDGYAAAHLATSTLRESLGSKLITWPNLFYSGQTPDTVTLKTSQGTTIKGPLETYQSSGVYACWQSGLSVTETISRLSTTLPFSESVLSTCIDQSLNTLKHRESQLDVKITDFLARHQHTQRLFFTFNHPTSRLLLELCERLCKAADIHVQKKLIGEFSEEPLGRLTVPLCQPMAEFLQVSYPYTDACRGRLVSLGESEVSWGANHIYAFTEFVEMSFKCFDTQIGKDESLSMTPVYGVVDKAA